MFMINFYGGCAAATEEPHHNSLTGGFVVSKTAVSTVSIVATAALGAVGIAYFTATWEPADLDQLLITGLTAAVIITFIALYLPRVITECVRREITRQAILQRRDRAESNGDRHVD